jgi:hypothetical protein
VSEDVPHALLFSAVQLPPPFQQWFARRCPVHTNRPLVPRFCAMKHRHRTPRLAARREEDSSPACASVLAEPANRQFCTGAPPTEAAGSTKFCPRQASRSNRPRGAIGCRRSTRQKDGAITLGSSESAMNISVRALILSSR